MGQCQKQISLSKIGIDFSCQFFSGIFQIPFLLLRTTSVFIGSPQTAFVDFPSGIVFLRFVDIPAPYLFDVSWHILPSVVVNIISLSRFQEAPAPLFTKAFSQPKPSERLQNFHIYAMLLIDVSWAMLFQMYLGHFPMPFPCGSRHRDFFMSITACPMPAALL